MKIITKEDLVILVNLIPTNSFSIKDFELILERYGDDWFIEGNEFVKTKENEIMKSIRNDKSLS